MKYSYLLILPVLFIATIMGSGIVLKELGEAHALKQKVETEKFKDYLKSEVRFRQSGVEKKLTAKRCE